MDKDEIIKSITQRIKDEYRKHPTLEWEDIAARKIYSSHIKTYNKRIIRKIEKATDQIDKLITKLSISK